MQTQKNRITLLDNKGHQCIIYTKNIEEQLEALDITEEKKPLLDLKESRN